MFSTRGLAILLALTAPLASAQALLAANSSDPSKFIQEYYQAKAKVKFPMEVKGFYSARVCEKQKEFEKMKAEKPAEFAMMMQMIEMIGSQEPVAVKVIGKNPQASDSKRDIYDVDAVEMPASVKKMVKPGAKISYHGQIGIVKEGGELKIDKDYWKFESAGKDGKFSASSGLNPDKDKDAGKIANGFSGGSGSVSSVGSGSSGGSDSAISVDASSGFDSDDASSRLMSAWKDKGSEALHNSKGKSIFTAITIDGAGEIISIKAGGEKSQPVAEKELVAFLRAVQPFKPVPAKYAGQNNIWMSFDWAGEGQAISGPYYSTEPVPGWVMDKISGKAGANN